MTLCTKCQTHLAPDLEKDDSRGWKPCFTHDRQSLVSASQEGCYFCANLWNALPQSHRDVVNGGAFQGIRCEAYLPPGSRYYSKVSFRFGESFDDCGWPYSQEFTIFPPDEPDLVVGSSLALKSNSAECWRLIHHWIETCTEKHTKCLRGQTSFLPTRLIDISPPGMGPGIIRIIEPAESPVSDPYLALSHCWGTKPFLTNTVSTHPELKRGIPTASLPTSFREAISTTRRLGFRYIWIDSLCIIQDHAADWDAEAPMMHHIYKNATLTLASLGSSDAFGGFFHDRSPVLSGAFRLPDSSLAVRSDLWLTEFHDAPLNQRAWVLQERLLAPRTLHFGKSQLFWECRELEACETFPAGIPTDQFATSYLLREHDGFKRWEEQIEREGGGTAYDQWELILQEYTGCQLTKGKDKFVALSGVVKEFERVLGDRYLAGLWEGNFVSGLLWYVDTQRKGDGAKRPVGDYRAPSWSWAAIDGKVAVPFGPELGKEWVEIKEIEVVPKGKDKIAEITSAWIKLSCYLIKIKRPELYEVAARVLGGTVYPDVRSEILDAFYYALPVKEHTDAFGTRSLYGLLLQSTDDKNQCRFRRVGLFFTHENDPLEILGQYKPAGWDYERKRDWLDTTGGMKEIVII